MEDTYGNVRVRGEISGFRGPHSSGHCYFSLKDESAKIEAVIWKGVHGRMRFKPQEGLEVIATGKLTTYPGSSKYQIVIEAIEPAGVGALMALMEERKRKLGAGRPVRRSAQAAAAMAAGGDRRGDVADRRGHSRYPASPGRPLPAPRAGLAGEGSGRRFGRAGRGRDPWLQCAAGEGGAIPRPDLLIVARGGGSLEDLWSFNEEIVVRAAAESMIPLISAVGHETDITLIDFAADKRAPTPTAAAEMAVPVRAELMVEISGFERRMMLCWQRGQESRRNELRAAARALPDLSELLAIPRQRLDGATASLPRASESKYTRASSPLRAGQRRADAARAARADRPRHAATDGIG